MKSALAIMLAASFATAALASSESSDAILRLLNSRSAGSPLRYAQAASVVAADAKRGLPLQQFVLAIIAGDPDAPSAARIPDEQRKAFLEGSRPKIKALAEEKGNAFAWYLLYLETGDVDQLERAAAGGNVQALNSLGTKRLTSALERPDEPGSRAAMEQAFGFFRRAAATGDANAVNNVGICLMNGYGCERDEAGALECFRKAGESGHPEAVNNEGRFHREGIVVEKSFEAAFNCFRRSAAQGNTWGQLNYALALMRGEGAPRDVNRARELLVCIAMKGVPQAMDVLADLYERGDDGVEADAMESAVWTVRARAARGDENAAKWLDANGKRLGKSGGGVK